MLKLTQEQIIQKAKDLGLEVIDYDLQFDPPLAQSWYDITHGIEHHDIWSNGTMQDIHVDHKIHLKYRGTGYHFRFPQTGGVEIGRPVGMIGAHCSQKEMNYRSLGLVWAGNFDVEKMNEVQFEDSAKFLSIFVDQLIFEHHRDYAKKTCPGKNFPSERLIARAKEIAEADHWAEEHFAELNKAFEKNEVKIHERRFDDPITRGENMAIQNNLRKLFMSEMEELKESVIDAYMKGVLDGRSGTLEHQAKTKPLSSD